MALPSSSLLAPPGLALCGAIGPIRAARVNSLIEVNRFVRSLENMKGPRPVVHPKAALDPPDVRLETLLLVVISFPSCHIDRAEISDVSYFRIR